MANVRPALRQSSCESGCLCQAVLFLLNKRVLDVTLVPAVDSEPGGDA